MKIVVCIKRVPKSDTAKVDKKTGTLIRSGVESGINTDDLYALEEALSLKAQIPGTTVTVLSMGAGDAEASLREAMALGADDGILLSDRILAGSDAWATGNALTRAIQKFSPDLVLTGMRSSDAGSNQIAARIACGLGWPLVTSAAELSVTDRTLSAKQLLDEDVVTGETALPAVAAVAPEQRSLSALTAHGIVDAYHKKTVTVWSAKDVGVDPARVGLKQSLSQVTRTWVPQRSSSCEYLKGSAAETAAQLMEKLKSRHMITEGER